MLHIIIMGILLGAGAAIPIGPINLEMMRRNLRLGTRFGIALGLGACTADLTYVLLLAFGALSLLNHPLVLGIIGIVGSCILAWFGWQALRMNCQDESETIKTISVARGAVEGFVLTLINPYTILFWASVSSQLLLLTQGVKLSVMLAATGVILGVLAWVFTYNTIIHFTKHKLSAKTIHRLNQLGGVILIGFAVYGLYHALIVIFK